MNRAHNITLARLESLLTLKMFGHHEIRCVLLSSSHALSANRDFSQQEERNFRGNARRHVAEGTKASELVPFMEARTAAAAAAAASDGVVAPKKKRNPLGPVAKQARKKREKQIIDDDDDAETVNRKPPPANADREEKRRPERDAAKKANEMFAFSSFSEACQPERGGDRIQSAAKNLA